MTTLLQVRWLRNALFLWLGAWGLFAAGVSYGDVAVPPLTVRVTDLTGTLSATQIASLENKLHDLETRKGSQVAILIIPTTEPEAIEQYALRVAEAWKLGRKGVDDGALLLVVKEDRTIRIEVGYGLEGVIPDVIAKRIINDIMVPFFRQGDYYGGIQAAVDRMIRLIDGEPMPAPEHRDTSWSGYANMLPLLFVAVLVLGSVLRAIFGQFIGASIVGSVVGLALWMMIGSFLLAIITGIFAFIFTLSSASRTGRGIYPGSFGGGIGSPGGGGFRGGGGGFGGGGASGRW